MTIQFSRKARPSQPGEVGHNMKSALFGAGLLILFSSVLLFAAGDKPFLPIQVRSASTVPSTGPSTGDQNPYGVAFVPRGFPGGGAANPGDILVSNFNDSTNTQGKGTSIMDVSPTGAATQFFQGSGTGLTTALNVLSAGFVLVGNFPAPCGSQGSILVIDKTGTPVGNPITDPLINGPWDSTLFDRGDSAKFFVANANTGTVVRIELAVSAGGVTVKGKVTQIASGYQHQCVPLTFVQGPTGLVYDPKTDILYVASTQDNEVFAVEDAGGTTTDGGLGTVVYSDNAHLRGPLGMTEAPNGHLIVANNDNVNGDPNQPSELVEFTKNGKFVKQISVDPLQGGSFGLAVGNSNGVTQLAAVDDNQSILLIWNITPSE
jgi:hypothetical protein